jgi:hypothetical protein
MRFKLSTACPHCGGELPPTVFRQAAAEARGLAEKAQL